MQPDNLPTREQIERYARQAGLTNLTSPQMEEFLRAATYARDLLAKLPRDFAISDEPAHVFRAGDHA